MAQFIVPDEDDFEDGFLNEDEDYFEDDDFNDCDDDRQCDDYDIDEPLNYYDNDSDFEFFD